MADELLDAATQAIRESEGHVGDADTRWALLRRAQAYALVSIAHSLDKLANPPRGGEHEIGSSRQSG